MRCVWICRVFFALGLFFFVKTTSCADIDAHGLVGHWKLQGDCLDSSGHGNHAVNHGVRLENGEFDGVAAYLEVPSSDSLQLGTGDFTICARIHTDQQLADIVGDVVDWYDPANRRGVTLSINSSAGGYQSQGTDRHVHFGIDNAKLGDWQDCGRPNPESNYVSNSLTVFDGKLYAATTGGEHEKDWAHVYRYEGDQKWTDCGRVGDRKTPGVVPLIVHEGSLYAATSTYDWTRVNSGNHEPGHVYRYAGGTQWEDCGQVGDDCTLNCIASYAGKLYVGGGPSTLAVFSQPQAGQWSPSQVFPKRGSKKCFPHAMCLHNGKLFTAFQNAYSFDGERWTYAGVPSPPEATLQTHSLTLYQGKLHAGTWPVAKVAAYDAGENWHDIGRVGVDGTEVNALCVYNGKLYGGSLPRSEVCRYDGQPEWTSLKRFYSPAGWKPVPPIENGGKPTGAELNDWSRLTSMTVFDGKLFCSTGSCTSSVDDAPVDVRGKVFSIEAGKMASYDGDLGAGWKRLAAVRESGRLKIYVDGTLVAKSTPFDPADYELSTDSPLCIGFGQTEYFAGKINDLRIYRRALSKSEVQAIASTE